ncbi:MAG: hypothetical protein ACRD20_20300 [Terriglobales bacterium]
MLRDFSPEEPEGEGTLRAAAERLAFFQSATPRMRRKLSMTCPLNGNGRKFSY